MAFEIKNRRYTGSKSKISDWIRKLILEHCVGSKSFCDIFAGTATVTNSVYGDYLKFIINDFLYSNVIVYNAFFGMGEFDDEKLLDFQKKYKSIKSENLLPNYVSLNFGDKYFAMSDALIIGDIREDIEKNKKNLNKREYDILLASLIYSFDRIANTVGHYEAYIKNGILKNQFSFELVKPVNNNANFKEVSIYREDANELAKKIRADVIYIDPPYSSRQYSRFYHVIETIVKWNSPELFGIARKPRPENISEYSKSKAINSFDDLITNLKCKYLVVSYNNTYSSKSKSSKNKMTLEQIETVLSKKGVVERFDTKHKPFNAGKTDLSNHKEYLFIVKVGEK